ncbi:hypothetical protein BGE01nite_12680 [Brevifollis gellanilyticus]|uniref:Uncharacterized protein n=2 Tax=Brevifollis gellanilyticus TaxID=748831 RepID=A0A512M5G6_9BACT|nr:hypothetical protein BGE01nite_12680 [Brevifollis gellanilyticus]
MTLVSQRDQYACAAACVESIQRDWGGPAHRVSLVSRSEATFPVGRYGGKVDDHKYLRGLCARCGLKSGVMDDPSLYFDPEKEALLAYVHWYADEDQKQCVRIMKAKGDQVLVMTPLDAALQLIPREWIQETFLVWR